MIDFRPGWRSAISSLLLLGGMVAVSDISAQTTSEKKTVTGGQAAQNQIQNQCVPVASWVIPGKGETTLSSVLASMKDKSVVLLGETHINPEHHRWQLQMLAILYAAHPDMVIGFEMFPRRVQKVLDQWVAGELTESEFLIRSEWQSVWSTDAGLYLPLFHFARMNRIPMRALNIDTRLRQAVTAKGFDSVPEKDREGITRPAPPVPEYLEFLLPIYQQHDRTGHKTADKKQKSSLYDADFLRFVVSQQLWDRAMAQEIHAALNSYDKHKKPLVVGIMGSGHILRGFGVPHQLKDLGVKKTGSLLPWDTNRPCKSLVEGYADAVFGLAPFAAESGAPSHQRLGIGFESGKKTGGALVLQVEPKSIAESAGLQAGDVIMEMAGSAIRESGEVVATVKRQAPGTWLPLKVLREGVTIEIIAKFPPLTQ